MTTWAVVGVVFVAVALDTRTAKQTECAYVPGLCNWPAVVTEHLLEELAHDDWLY